jgi:Family of unknown function (DUF6994)
VWRRARLCVNADTGSAGWLRSGGALSRGGIVRAVRDIAGFDPTFDFRSDAGGDDPDSTSPTLRDYHMLLWSKPLPDGAYFELDDITAGAYLHHRSEHGEFFLASDAAIPTFIRYLRIPDFVRLIPKSQRDEFDTITYQMGGMMLFPGNKIDGKQTINGAKGFNRQICDRLDLTVECIRQHYQHNLEGNNPLADVLSRYGDFFALFEDFGGFVDFFLLQDLVSDDFSSVRFFMPHEGLGTSPLPSTLDSYQVYRKSAVEFVEARNRRMTDYAARR